MSENPAPKYDMSPSKLVSLIGLVEYFNEYPRTLNLIVAVLLADIVTASAFGDNVMSWNWDRVLQPSSLWVGLSVLFLYGLVTSLVAPSLYEFFGYIARCFTKWGSGEDTRPFGSVSATELQDFADAEQSTYAKQACNEARAQQELDRIAVRLAGRFSLAIGSLLALNVWVVSPRQPTATATLFDYLGAPAISGVVSVAFLVTFLSWHVKPHEWIRFLPAYRAVMDKTGPFQPKAVVAPPFRPGSQANMLSE